MKAIRILPVLILTSTLLLGLKSYQWITGDPLGLSGVDVAVAQDADAPGMDEAPVDGAPETATGDDEGMADDMSDDMAVAEAPEELESVDQVDFTQQSSRELLLERLGERRVILEEREQDLRVREQLLAAAERRLEERMSELAALEERVLAADVAQEERANEEIGRLVQVYSAMRAKDAAAIFDLLDLPILMEVAKAMNPRKMADILGEMTPESARRLTIALAGRPAQPVMAAGDGPRDLPQIEGTPIQ